MKNRFVRYLLVGILNTVFGYSLYAFFIFLNLHYSVAVLLGTVLGVLFNFKTIGKLVFKSHNNALIFRFVTVYALTYFVNVGGLRIFKGYNINMYLSGFLMLFPATVISYTLHKRFVFKESL